MPSPAAWQARARVRSQPAEGESALADFRHGLDARHHCCRCDASAAELRQEQGRLTTSMHLSSRSLSVILAIVALYRMWPNKDGLVSIAMAMAAPLVLIWFPEQIDEYTFG